MRALKVLGISLIATVIAVFATINSWQSKSDIRITFKAKSTRDIQYQVFYTGEDGKISEEKSIRQLVPAGEKNVEIILPTEEVVQLRLDFGSYPKTVIISDLKLIGNKEINLLTNKEEKFDFSAHIKEYQFMDGNVLRIVSDENDPFMIYKDKLNVIRGTVINWSKLLKIAFGTFFVVLLLGLFVTRKKAEKTEEKSPKNAKNKK